MSRGFGRPSESSEPPRPLLKDQLNLLHSLVRLGQAIDWGDFEREFGQQMRPEGERPPLPTRLLVGLH